MSELMTEKHPQMRDFQLTLDERIWRAQDRISKGHCIMRIPVEATDPDIVLADCATELQRLRSEIALRDEALEWIVTAFSIQEAELPAEFAEILSGKADSEVAK